MGERGPDFDAFIKAKPVRSNTVIAMREQRHERGDEVRLVARIDKSKVESIETRADGTVIVTDKKGNMATIQKDDEQDPAEILKQLDY